MKSEDLLKAFTDLDDSIVLDVQENAPTRKRSEWRLPAVLTAAVIASTMVLTAFASADGAVWFKNFFAQKTDQSLSGSQKDYIGDNTIQVRQSQTVNGYTIALESAISDGNRTFIQCKLTAPEGTVLDADHYDSIHDTVFISKDRDNDFMMGGYGWSTEDDDPTDNTVTMLFTFEASWAATSTASFTEQTWQLSIYGLQARYYEGEGMDMTLRDVPLSEGTWSFDIQFPEGSDREIEFITEPVDCPCEIHTGFIRNADGNSGQFALDTATVQVTSFTLRSLSADFYYQYSEKDTINAEFDDFYVVMKDGSKVLMKGNSFCPNFNSYQFDVPIILDEVDHILLPDGIKLPTPQG